MRYFDPSKVELLGRDVATEEVETHNGSYGFWILVAVLGDGQRVMAIDITDGSDQRKVSAMILSGRYPYSKFYKIPHKYAFVFKIND
jgi:hypothetical protein